MADALGPPSWLPHQLAALGGEPGRLPRSASTPAC